MIFISSEGDVISTESNKDLAGNLKPILDFWYSDTETLKVNTSGSTGTPKQINISKTQIAASVEITQAAFLLEENDLFYCCLSLKSIAGIMMVLRALIIKAELIIVEPISDPFSVLKHAEYLLKKKKRKTFYAFVPLQIQNALQNPDALQYLRQSKAIIIGGAKISETLEKEILDSSIIAHATYGMTETLSHIAIKKINSKKTQFKALPGIQIRINENSCLEIKGAVTNKEWISTNDIVELKGKNSFEIIGRADNVINSGGVKLHLESIESKILSLMPEGTRYFCSSLPDEKLGSKLVLVVESEKWRLEEKALREILTNFEVPKEYFYTRKFTETLSGKIDKIKTLNEILEHQVPNL